MYGNKMDFQLVEFVTATGDKFGCASTEESFSDYLRRLGRDREWGGTSELMALASLLNTRIHTFIGSASQRSDVPWATFEPRPDVPSELPPTDKEIFIANRDSHYEPILEIDTVVDCG